MDDPQSEVAERASSRPVRSDVAGKGPVFVDLSGRRGRLVRHAGALAGAVCFGYSAVLGMGFAGGTAIAPETLIPGHPVTTEAFGREPKGAPEGHPGGRSDAHEYPSEDHGYYRPDGDPDRPRPYFPADAHHAGARKPTALARPAPPRTRRAPSARGKRSARGEHAARPGRRPAAHQAAHHAPRHQRSTAHRPGHAPHHPRPHKPASSHTSRPAPHKPPRKPVDPAPDPARKPPAAHPAKPAEPGPDRPQNPGKGQAKPPVNEPEPPVWGPATPAGINWQSLTPFGGGVS
ncbi:hypothetical protein ABZ370_42155 [Streptomyces sp. NPDC005962]|uniref:hypothetical protein n=1 Tax=Streptomyces sp. NPDC005962 TaxID=3154466 RepID=UPI0033CA9D3C